MSKEENKIIGVILKISNEIVFYPFVLKKKEGISVITTSYRFLFLKLTIIKTNKEQTKDGNKAN